MYKASRWTRLAVIVLIIMLVGAGAPPASAAKISVLAWGHNNAWQLGDGTDTERTAPVLVNEFEYNPDIGAIKAVAAGGDHSLALTVGGAVWSWGGNAHGQRGVGWPPAVILGWQGTPTRVQGPDGQGFLTDIIAISAGEGHSLALRNDGTVWAWGWNEYGQLGDDSTQDRAYPVQVVQWLNASEGLGNIVAISAGTFHSLAIEAGAQSRVWAWGDNGYGQLGLGIADPLGDSVHPRPQMVVDKVRSPGAPVYTMIAAGGGHSMAARADGILLAWGSGQSGELGSSTFDDSVSPRAVDNLPREPGAIKAIAAGGAHSLALVRSSDGRGDVLWAWGDNEWGQLGISIDVKKLWRPRQVASAGGRGVLDSVVDVQAGGIHTVALRSDGSMYAWGGNEHGQLGDATVIWRKIPVQVRGGATNNPFLTGMTGSSHTFDAGTRHTLALWTAP